MVFTDVSENVFRETLVETKSLNKESFNPCDYMKFTTLMKTRLDEFHKIATLHVDRATSPSSKRVFSGGVDRVTGEVYQPSNSIQEEKEVGCIKFKKGDILFHKIGARIGRIGLADFDGYGENEFVVIRTANVNAHYLLLTLRSYDVLIQLPFRETARPRIKRKDILRLRIPRLQDSEDKIGSFLSRVFELRKRARTVLNELLDNFDKAISAKMPTDYSFLMQVQTLTDDTLDPGYYFTKIVEAMFPRYTKLSSCVDVIHPSTLERGSKYYVVTAKSYRFEGLVPERPRGVSALANKNFASKGDIILNRIISSEKAPWKATIVPAQLDYLEPFGLTIKHSKDGQASVPISEDLFILRSKADTKASPYYLALVLNSLLCRTYLNWIMGGSTGMQVVRKTRLEEIRVPLLEEHIMQAFSVATKICLEILSDTLRMLVCLTELYKEVICGEEPPQRIDTLIQKELTRLKELEGNALDHTAKALLKTRTLKYEVKTLLLS